MVTMEESSSPNEEKCAMFATLPRFIHLEPAVLSEALALLAEYGDRARVLAGGCDLLPELRRRRSRPAAVVALTRLRELEVVELDVRGLRVAAMASLRSVELAPGLREHYGALHDGIHSLASVQVRTTGTLVGNLCVATPASDIAPPLMVLGATLRIHHAGGERTIPVAELFAGPKRHTLAPGELVTGVEVPPPPRGAGSAFGKLTRTAADIAKLNAAALVVTEAGVCREARIALGALAPVPIRAQAAERALAGRTLDPRALDAAAELAAGEIRPVSDLRSTAEYRRAATRILVRRVLEQAALRARGAGGVA
jgi:carbon-monoxide dehydrogenase medium subunit